MKLEITGEWIESLTWCPSQCYLNIRINSRPYHIYLRWRGIDPWSCTVSTNHIDPKWMFKRKHELVTPDLFKLYNLHLTKVTPLHIVENKAIKVTKTFFERKLNKQCVICGEDGVITRNMSINHKSVIYPLCHKHYLDFIVRGLRYTIKELKHIENRITDSINYLEWLVGGDDK